MCDGIILHRCGVQGLTRASFYLECVRTLKSLGNTSWSWKLMIWLQGFSKQARQKLSSSYTFQVKTVGIYLCIKGFWCTSVMMFKKTQRWMKHDAAVVTGSSIEMGHFCDLSWGLDGWFLSLFTVFLGGFLKSSIFVLASFGKFIKHCSSIVTKPDSYFFFQITVLTIS